ncbi:hypothetical protein [Burkholderia sp. BCC1644]|uniref:hypothetical protein n=1 Tax=Burkholderia sp. BCC1644 TaxID=2676293 RepID=UPI001FC846DE|nr:hypothetical protein [Burkholderia sp. BCC1644]
MSVPVIRVVLPSWTSVPDAAGSSLHDLRVTSGAWPYRSRECLAPAIAPACRARPPLRTMRVLRERALEQVRYDVCVAQILEIESDFRSFADPMFKEDRARISPE